MRLRADQLSGSLSRQLASLYLVSGDEPLLVDEALAAIRARAAADGITERTSHVVERGFDWDALDADAGNLSLFASGKLIELRLPKGTPGEPGGRRISSWAGAPPDGNLRVILTPALTGRAAQAGWIKAIVADAVWVETREPKGAELLRWLGKRLAAEGLDCDQAGLELLAARVEGNLLAAAQEVAKLALLFPRGTALDAAQLQESVGDGARFDVFQLADAALAGDAPRALRVLGGLEREGIAATLVLWSLVREIMTLVDIASRMAGGTSMDQALRAAGVWQSREAVYQRALRRLRPGAARRLVRQAALADRVVKGARPGLPWNALRELALALASGTGPGAELAA